MTDPREPHPFDRDEPSELTQRHDAPDFPGGGASPAVPPASEPGAFPAATEPEPFSHGPEPRAFSPAPEPRSDWSRTAWTEPAPTTTPERWYEPPTPVTEPVSRESARRGGGPGIILGAALLSAVLASGGTVLTLSATGALDRPLAPASTPGGATVSTRQPVTIDESSATIDVAANVSPAVVRISTSGSDEGQFGVIPDTGVGSGVIYDADGWILTNRHVVEGSGGLTVELKDGRTFSGRVYGIDTLTDLAIVKIDADDLSAASLGDSEALKVGQLVIAIGSPLGTYSNSVTSGIVSAKGRSITAEGSTQPLNNLIQTDAAINPGNSGGPLLDAAGNVVGINTAIARDSTGIGFAIPINIAKPIMEQAVAGQELARPYLGVRYEPVTVQLARQQNLPVDEGALVRPGTAADGSRTPAVEPGGPAEAAGLQAGDIIVSIDGQVVDGEHPLDATLSQHAPGLTVPIEVQRGTERLMLEVTLGTRPADL
jgi:S1-C subfamily serine protease